MIPAEKTRTVESNMTGEDVTMTLDANATAHLMSVLTDLYSDTELAILREYATNAADSHVEAGQSRPIEVSTPTALRPSLVVQDWGVGLSADDIRTIYSRYGASTKRATNDQSGTLGLGCKSALTYADSFTVEGRKDGQRVLVSVSRDEDGGGTMKILDESPTDEPDGATITIPCPRTNELTDKAREFFGYWQPGTVLLDGAEPTPVKGMWLTPPGADIPILAVEADNASSYYNREGNRVVMGNVAYPAEDLNRSARGGDRNYSVVAWVPMGAVDFAPSREALITSKRNDTLLTKIRGLAEDGRGFAALRAMEKAKSKQDAAAVVKRANRMRLPLDKTLYFDGAEVPTEFVPMNGSITVVGKRNGYSRYGSRNIHSSFKAIPFVDGAGALWVTDFDNANWTAQMRDKLDAYCEAHREDISADGACLTADDKVRHPDWVGTVISWADVRKFKVPGAKSGGSGTGNTYAGTYFTHLSDGTSSEKHPAQELAKVPSTSLYYCIGSKWTGAQEANLLREHDKAAVMVVLPQTRVEKFKRTFPSARLAQTGFAAAATAWWNGLTADQRDALRSAESDTMTENHAVKLAKDPELSPIFGDIARVAKVRAEDGFHKLRRVYQARTKYLTQGQRESYSASPSQAEVRARFPLLAHVRVMYGTPIADRTLDKHLTLYVKAVVAAETNQEDE